MTYATYTLTPIFGRWHAIALHLICYDTLMTKLSLAGMRPYWAQKKPCNKLQGFFKIWSAREDSNLRPTGPKPVALPGCATRRKKSLFNDVFYVIFKTYLYYGAKGGT